MTELINNTKQQEAIPPAVNVGSLKTPVNKLKVVIIGIICVVTGSMLFYIFFYRSAGSLTKAQAEKAYKDLFHSSDKTLKAESFRLDYHMKVISYYKNLKTGKIDTVPKNVDGYYSYSDDAESGIDEEKTYSPDTPQKSTTITHIMSPNGDTYMKNDKTAPKWEKFTRQPNYKKADISSPTDASLFGLQILNSIMHEDQPIIKSLSGNQIISSGSESIGGRTSDIYTLQLNTQSYIDEMSFLKSKDFTSNQISDAKKILKDANILITYYIDKNTGYIEKLHIDIKNLTQISTPELDKKNLIIHHDAIVDATVSQVGKPLHIAIPDKSELLKNNTIKQ